MPRGLPGHGRTGGSQALAYKLVADARKTRSPYPPRRSAGRGSACTRDRAQRAPERSARAQPPAAHAEPRRGRRAPPAPGARDTACRQRSLPTRHRSPPQAWSRGPHPCPRNTSRPESCRTRGFPPRQSSGALLHTGDRALVRVFRELHHRFPGALAGLAARAQLVHAAQRRLVVAGGELGATPKESMGAP